jgi:hypothetical protein
VLAALDQGPARRLDLRDGGVQADPLGQPEAEVIDRTVDPGR